MCNNTRFDLDNIEVLKEEQNKVAREALDTMCKKCHTFDICKATGCQPKKDLMKVIEEAEITDKYIKIWSELIETN